MRVQKTFQFPVCVMYGLQHSPCDLCALLCSEVWYLDQRTLLYLLHTLLTLRCALFTTVIPIFTGKETRDRISLDIQSYRKQVTLVDHD